MSYPIQSNLLGVAIRRAMLATVALSAASSAFAQDQASEQTETTTLDRIEVTGSRIKRTDVETSQPILSLSREDIQAQGLTSVGDVIQNITANGSTLNTTMNNGGNGETQVTLRNLGSNRTLVLVNGRRWVGGTGLGGAVDLNTIPTAAVERIEVLKDGASTIYGSDAIAGVVNVILRQNFDGAEANAYIGQYDKGDGTRQAYDFTVGSSGDRWSAMVGIGYVKEESVSAGDREISAVPVFGSTPNYGGSTSTPDGRFCVTGRVTNPKTGKEDVGCFQPNGLPNVTVDDPNNGEYGLWRVDPNAPRGFVPWAGTADNFNFAPLNHLLTPQERVSVFASGSLDITDNVRFKLTTTFNQRRSDRLLAAMPVVVGFPGVAQASDIVISADSLYNPYDEDINWIQRRVTETGGRLFTDDVDTFAFHGGFEGAFEIGERFWDWEAGMFFGENERNTTTDGLLTYTALRNALGPSMIDPDSGNPICVTTPGDASTAIGGCVPANFLGGADNGTLTPEMLEYLTFEAHDNFGYKQKTYYANVGGDLFDLPGGPLAFSFGVEHREESGYDAPDALINAGDTTGNARTATSGSYSLDEAYLEFAIPVLSDVPGAQLLDFSVATRYSNYSNFGNTLNSKFGFRWKPIDDLLIRGNWSEGFRAPSISELFSGLGDSFPNLSDPCNDENFAGLSAAGQAQCVADGVPQGGHTQLNTQIRISVGGNPALLPEKATTKTLGFVYSPGWLTGFDISLDWWQIELTDAISGFTGEGIADQCYREGNPIACAQITRGPGGFITDLVSSGLNFATIDVEGYDMTVGYRMPETAWGKFSFVWDSTYLANFENFGDGDNLAGEYFDRNNNWRLRSNLTARWEKGDWGASWFMRYYSSQVEDCTGINAANLPLLCSDPDRRTAEGAAPRNHIPSVIYNDAQVFFNAPWNMRISLGVNNIFDRDPPFSATTFANSFDPQYELPGRFYYMKFTQKF